MAIDTSQFKNGVKIEIDGNPFVITYFQHVKPGKGGAFVRTKLKNLGRKKTLFVGNIYSYGNCSRNSIAYIF